jgi:diketogulonate reductase-like aldo/keto reductase
MQLDVVRLSAVVSVIAIAVLANVHTPMMAPVTKTVTLNSGKAIPAVGLGVFLIRDGCVDVVKNALRIGYRHIDTAHYYNNEREIGRAVRDSGVPREEIFVTSKLWLSQFGHTAAKRVRLQCLA